MFSGEWPLILFTILTQCAVGTWLSAVILRASIAKRTDPAMASQLTWRSILIVGPIMCIALVISIFHLGTPMQAYSSIANLGSSWLSREIVFSGLFLFFWITAYINYRKVNTGSKLGIMTSILGLLAVFSMSSIYYHTPIPAWAISNTYVSFFATTMILGSIACSIFIGLAGKRKSLNQDVRRLIWKVSLGTLIITILQLFFHIPQLSVLTQTFLIYLYGLSLIVGSIIFTASWYIYSTKPTHELSRAALYLSFALIFFGEVIGRYLFYVTAVPMMG